MFNQSQLEALKAPLNRSNVKTRQQAGRAMSYVEGWHAIAEANRIFGFDGWDRETVELRQLGDPVLGKNKHGDDQWRVAYYARIRVTVRALEDKHAVVIAREGCGYGSGIDKDLGSAHESALKEAETDAMKRALMTFGNPFGLALYDKEQAEVVDDTKSAAPKAALPAPSTSKPNGSPTKKTPYQWAMDAGIALKAMKTGDELVAWEHVNAAAIEKLKSVDPTEHAELDKELRRAYARFSTVNA